MSPARLVLVLAVAVVVLLPGTASAADTVLSFDNQPVGTQLGGQYFLQGVEFAVTPSGQTTLSRPEVVDGGGRAHSGAQVVSLFNCDKEFCFSGLSGKFSFSHQKVAFYAGTAPGTTAGQVKLTARDANGSVVGTDTKLIADGANVDTIVEVQSATSNIVYFDIEGGVAIDDFTYDTPASPPPPDFGLAIDTTNNLNPSGDVGLLPGDGTTVKLVVNRFNGAQGNVAFGIAGLPAGITHTWAPASVAGTPTVTLNLAAPKNAPKASANVTVTATPQSAQAGSAPRTLVFHLVVLGRFDIRVTGIEVTQGIQSEVSPCNTPASCTTNVSLPARSASDPAAPIAYQGVLLAAHGKTVARVFANVRTPAGGTVDGVEAVLRGFRNGQELPGSPLLASGRTLAGGRDAVSFLERTNPSGPFTFVLPPGWTEGVLNLRAEIVPPLAFIGTVDSECEDAICAQNNRFDYNGISFQNTGSLRVSAARMWWTGERPNDYLPGSVPGGAADPEGEQRFFPCPREVFAQATSLMPVGEGQFDVPACGYDGTLDISWLHQVSKGSQVVPSGVCASPLSSAVEGFCNMDLKDGDDFKNGTALDILEEWADEHPFCKRRSCADITAGVNAKVARGISAGGQKITEGNNPMFVVDYGNPLNSVGHELFHGLGRVHASKGCGGNDDGQVGEDWPPDGVGFIQGIGLDRRAGSGGTKAAFRIIAPGNYGAPNGVPDDPDDPGDPFDSFNPKGLQGTGAQPGDWYDFLSYCAGQGGAWISTKGWNDSLTIMTQVSSLLETQRAARAARAAGASLNVRGMQLPDGLVVITSVKPGIGRPQANAGSPYRAVVKDAGGAQLGEAGLVVTEHDGHGQQPTFFFNAEFPVNGSPASVEFVKDGQSLARLNRSANAPKGRFTSPRKGARVGGRPTVVVTWKASDADGATLRTKLDYSYDGGRTWRPIFASQATRRALLPAADLSASRKARLRLRLSDGFNVTTLLSPVFRSKGRPPSVAITSPEPGVRLNVRADETLYLSGTGTDDRDQQLSGKRLRWFDGRRAIGRGVAVAVNGLRPGKRTLRLVARDARGRRATARVRVTV